MSAEVIRAYYEAFNRGDREGMLALLDRRRRPRRQPGRARDRQGRRSRRFLAHMDRCYRERLTDIVVMASADGSRAAAEFVVDGTYLATDAGLPPATRPDLPPAGRHLLRAARRAGSPG